MLIKPIVCIIDNINNGDHMKPQIQSSTILAVLKATFERLVMQQKAAAEKSPSPFNVIRRDGWSVAQGKRMAKKARNVRRYRAACR